MGNRAYLDEGTPSPIVDLQHSGMTLVSGTGDGRALPATVRAFPAPRHVAHAAHPDAWTTPVARTGVR